MMSGFERFEQRKKSLESDATIHRVERLTSPHTHPGGSVLRLMAQKLRVLAVFMIRRLAQGAGRVNALAPLAALGGSASSKEVLVIASGPSAGTLKARAVATAMKKSGLVVVATNYFLSSDLAKTISPNYLMWSDSVFHPSNRHNNPSWQLLQQHPQTVVVCPWTWRSHIPGELQDRFLFFDNDSLETWSRNVSPLKPRGYQGTTGSKALSLGLHLGPQRVLVIGLDLSYFKNFSVDADNRLHRHPTHLAGTDSGSQELGAHTINGIADSLYSTATQFLHLRNHFGSKPIVNLDPHSLVDAFPKHSSHPLVSARRSGKK